MHPSDLVISGRELDVTHAQAIISELVYTSQSANGEELPDMEKSEWHAFWRWRDEPLRLKAAAQATAGRMGKAEPRWTITHCLDVVCN